MGLSMVQGIVAQSGGHITVETGPSQGASFRVYLPLAPTPTEPMAPAAMESGLRGDETVLVVEDQESVRRFAAEALREYGYKVYEARSAAEAKTVFASAGIHFDLLLTDVVMPDASGTSLAADLSCIQPELPALFMSGYTDNVVVHHGVLDPGRQFIQKPFRPEDLAAKVRAVLHLD